MEISDTYTAEPLFTEEHVKLRKTLRGFIEEWNQECEEWEEQEIFPAHRVIKQLGDAGLLGISKSEDYGGLGLDFSYTVAMAEELGRVNAGGIGMAIGVHTDMCTPALARFGSE